MIRRGLRSEELNRHEAGRDMGRWCVLPREALLSCRRPLPETTAKPNRRGDPEARRGRGWQIHGEYRRLRADEAVVTAWRIKP